MVICFISTLNDTTAHVSLRCQMAALGCNTKNNEMVKQHGEGIHHQNKVNVQQTHIKALGASKRMSQIMVRICVPLAVSRTL